MTNEAKKKQFKLSDFSKKTGRVTRIENSDLMPLPAPLDQPESEPEWREISDEANAKYEALLDNTMILNIPKPESAEQEKELVEKFLDGVGKLFSAEDNWPFLRLITLSMEHCAQCQTCFECGNLACKNVLSDREHCGSRVGLDPHRLYGAVIADLGETVQLSRGFVQPVLRP